MGRSTGLLLSTAVAILAGGTFAAERAARAVAAPPQCPWEFQSYQILNPFGAQGALPLNGSIWIRNYQSTLRFSLWDPVANELVPTETLTTTVTQTFGTLVQLHPFALLEAGHNYEVRAGDPALASVVGTVQTATTTDTQPPAAPTVTNSLAITDPYSVCQTAGVVFYYSLEDPNEALMIWAEDAEGNLLEMGSNPSLGPVYSGVAIPTMPHVQVDAKLVAVDYAGNRSDAIAVSATAGDTPQIVGKLPGDPVPNDPDNPFDGGGGGCDCRTGGSGAADSAWLAWAVLGGWLVRRRRRARL